MSEKHHVIFLGAGASKSSGYPVASGLRLLLSSQQRMIDGIKDVSIEVHEPFRKFLASYKDAISLFRNGGFASVDEFSKLASAQSQQHVGAMKKLTQLALGLHNPEDTFETSDYYGFVQRLFDANSLHTLRDDVSILSYNYDSYLDFLLLRAFIHRLAVKRDKNSDAKWFNRLEPV